MASRLDLQQTLENILGSRNVYFQPPENIRLEYPAIVYRINNTQKVLADNLAYLYENCYNITLIDPNPESQYYLDILSLPYCRNGSNYSTEGLNHFVFTLFY